MAVRVGRLTVDDVLHGGDYPEIDYADYADLRVYSLNASAFEAHLAPPAGRHTRRYLYSREVSAVGTVIELWVCEPRLRGARRGGFNLFAYGGSVPEGVIIKFWNYYYESTPRLGESNGRLANYLDVLQSFLGWFRCIVGRPIGFWNTAPSYTPPQRLDGDPDRPASHRCLIKAWQTPLGVITVSSSANPGRSKPPDPEAVILVKPPRRAAPTHVNLGALRSTSLRDICNGNLRHPRDITLDGVIEAFERVFRCHPMTLEAPAIEMPEYGARAILDGWAMYRDRKLVLPPKYQPFSLEELGL